MAASGFLPCPFRGDNWPSCAHPGVVSVFGRSHEEEIPRRGFIGYSYPGSTRRFITFIYTTNKLLLTYISARRVGAFV